MISVPSPLIFIVPLFFMLICSQKLRTIGLNRGLVQWPSRSSRLPDPILLDFFSADSFEISFLSDAPKKYLGT